MKSKIILYFIALILAGCSTMPREEFNRAYDITLPNKISDSVVIQIQANNNIAGSSTSMMPVGNLFINVPTGEKGPYYNLARFNRYGNRLASLLTQINAFKKSEYQQTPSEDNSESVLLLVRFNSTYMGGDGWPTNLDATFILQKDKKTIFEKSYKTSSGISGGCWDCYPDEIAEKKLNTKFFEDLSIWQKEGI